IRSLDGGETWTLLDSTTNVDSNGNTLPFNSPLRDHAFVGQNTYRLAIDPLLSTSGETIIYAAMTRGLYKSVDTGKHWTRLGLTPPPPTTDPVNDVLLAPDSAALPGTNLQVIYAAVQNEGVFISPNPAATWRLMPS